MKKINLKLTSLLVFLICIVCGVAISISLHKLYHLNQDNFNAIVKMPEEHYDIGLNLYTEGKLSLYGYPSVFRAPGYPVFVSFSLHVRDLIKRCFNYFKIPINEIVFQDAHFMVMMQLGVLLMGGICFYSSLRMWLHEFPSILFMIAYLINPFSLTIIRFLSYFTLDLFMITLIILCCSIMIKKDTIKYLDIFFLALLFTIAAFIRPIYITSPLLIFLLFWAKKINFLKILNYTILFTIFLILMISPYTIRNWRVSGKLILISNQGPWAFWSISIIPLYSDGEIPRWNEEIWYPYGLEDFQRITGHHGYSTKYLYQYSNELSEYYWKEFFLLIKSQPSVYIFNVFNNIKHNLFSPRTYFEKQWWRAIPENTGWGRYAWLRVSFSEFYRFIDLIVILLLPFLAYRKSLPAKLCLVLIFFLVFNYSIIIVNIRYLYFLLPLLLFSFAISIQSILPFNQKTPSWVEKGIPSFVAIVTIFFVSSPIISFFFIN